MIIPSTRGELYMQGRRSTPYVTVGTEAVDQRVLNAIREVEPFWRASELNELAIKVTNTANGFLRCAIQTAQAGKTRGQISLNGRFSFGNDVVACRRIELYQKLVRSVWGFELHVAQSDASIADFLVHVSGEKNVELTNFSIVWPNLQPFSKPETYPSAPSKFAGFQKLREEEFFTDVRIRSPESEYPVHRLVLAARSEVFKKAFLKSSSPEFNINVVDLGSDEKQFKEFIDFLYTDKINLENKEIEDINKLLVLADAYQVEGLVQACIGVLSTQLTETNIDKIRKFGETYHIQSLIDLCSWWVGKSAIEKLKRLPGGSHSEIAPVIHKFI